MTLKALLCGIEVKKTNADLQTQISQISSDSRGILRGGLFVCIKGTKTDGHRYIADAVENGAVTVVVEDASVVPDGVAYVMVDSTRVAEAYIWDNWYEHPAEGIKTVAITGTNGKTSTAFILESILRYAGKSCGIITTVCATVNGRKIGIYGGSSVTDADGAMTTPDPEYLFGALYAMKQVGVEYVVFEATSHALALHKTDPIRLDVAVFTNLSEEHLDFHGTMEGYFAAKARLAHMSDTLVINCDDRYMSRLESVGEKRVVTCSADPNSPRYLSADVSALRQETGDAGVEYIYFSEHAVFRVFCKIPGGYTVYNTLLAATAALELGVCAEDVRDGIASVKGVPGRLERVDIEADFEVFIDFAHTPDALEKLLETARQIRQGKGKIILLFGCGGDRDRSKRRKMGAVASRLADFAVITEDNSRSEEPREIINEIMSGIDLEKPHAVITDRREAIAYAVSIAEAGDIVLLAGKGHEKYEIGIGGKAPFDEAAIVKEAVARLRSDKK